MSPMWGALGDRYGRRTVSIHRDGYNAVSLGSLGVCGGVACGTDKAE